MTRNDDHTRLRHMLDHAVEAVEMTKGRVRADLDRDRQFNLALVRLVEIIGEAAARVSEDHRSRCPQIPWEDIVGMRNHVVHGYDDVDFDILWDVIDLHLRPLIVELRRALGENPTDQ